MALFEVEVTMNVGDRHWQNRWDVEAADIATVVGMADAFHDFHIAILLDAYQLGRIVMRPAGERDAFFEFIYDEAGSIAVGAGHLLPLFNTVFVALNTLAGGRPGKKFFRGALLQESLDAAGNIRGAALAPITTAVNGLIASVAALSGHIVLTNDKQVSTATAETPVQMRQLHRKRRNSL